MVNTRFMTFVKHSARRTLLVCVAAACLSVLADNETNVPNLTPQIPASEATNSVASAETNTTVAIQPLAANDPTNAVATNAVATTPVPAVAATNIATEAATPAVADNKAVVSPEPEKKTAAAPATKMDPALLPIQEIAEVKRNHLTTGGTNMVHVRGTALDQRLGENILIRDETGTLFAETTDSVALKPEETVDVWGTPASDGTRVVLHNASLHPVNAITRLVPDSDSPAERPAELPVLTTALQVRDLTADKAGWKYPAKLQGVVTFYLPERRLYIQDRTAGTYIGMRLTNAPAIKAGDLVEISGFTDPGLFAPIVAATQIVVVGSSPLPDARKTTLYQLGTGEFDGQWIEVHGVIRSQYYYRGMLRLKVSDSEATLFVNVPVEHEPSNLQDAVVRLRGICGSRFNDRRQLAGVVIWTPSLEQVVIEKPGVADPLSLPVEPIVSLSQFHTREALQRRVKISGVVTVCKTNLSFFVQDANDGIQVFMNEKTDVRPGDRVFAAGYAMPGDYGSVLQDAVVKVLEHGAVPEPKLIQPENTLDPRWHGRWVQLNARLLSHHVGNDRSQTLTLQFPGCVFEANCQTFWSENAIPATGTLLSLKGVYLIRANEDRVPTSFQLIVPSIHDIEVLEHPSWWTMKRTATAGGIMAVIIAAAILWGLLLRRKVREQTAKLRERFEHEAALEKRYREIFEAANDLIFTYDPEGKLTSLNTAGLRVLGYEADEIGQLTIDKLLTPDSRKRELEMRETELADGHDTTCELEMVGKDGRRVLVEASARLLVKDNRPVGIQSIARDITERKQAEAALQQSETKFRSLIEQSLVGVYIIQDGVVAYVNPRMAEIFGYTADEMAMLPIQAIIYDEDWPLVNEQIQRRLSGEVTVVHYSFRGCRKNGSVVFVEVLGSRTDFEGRPAVLGTLLDVTERKQAEQELFNSRQMLRTVLDTIPQRVFWKDRNSLYLGCNKALAEDCGCPDPNDLIGKSDYDLKPQEVASLEMADDREVMETGIPKLNYEEPCINPDGTQGWLRASKAPLYDQDGNVVGLLGTYEDITERKRADAALSEASSLLDTMLDNSPDYIYFKDRESRFVRYSRSLASLFKVENYEDLKGKGDFDFFQAEHARQAYEDEQHIMLTGEPLIAKPEKEVHADGRTTWALTTKLPWRDKNGNVIGTFGVSKDITELKVAEERLAREQHLFRVLLDSFPDVIYFKDLQSRFVRISRSKAERSMAIVLRQFQANHPDAGPDDVPEHLTSVEKFGEWLVGKSDFDTFVEARAQAAYDDEQKIIQTGDPIIGKIERTPQADGRITWCISTKMPWRDANGNTIGTFGVSKDITALKEAEEKLALERELFHALVDNLPDAIYFKDLQSRYVRLSRSKVERSREILVARFRAENPDAELPEHLTDSEKCAEFLMGKSDFDMFSENRARSAYNDEQEIIRSGTPIIGKPEHVKSPDGKVSWVLTTKMPWADSSGKIVGTFGVSRDITDIKEAEAQLESAHKRLIDTSRLAGMAEVATDVLHNVGNVLNSVNVSCSLTMDRVKASKISSLAKVASLLQEHRERLSDFFLSDPRGQHLPGYLATLSDHLSAEQLGLLKELEQLLKHIDHIKQIVTMQQNYAKVAGVLESIPPVTLVEDALHINAAALVRHDVHVVRDFHEAPAILTEKHKVLQILVNLIRNAKYAMDETKRSDKTLRLTVAGDGNGGVKIQVIDNGIGIPKENLTRIFSHGFTTRKEGHGFGLHSSALAVRDLGGAIFAESEGTGKGAVFTLILPGTPPERPQSEPKV
jgi:PAS domain S-box-containing protein